MRRFIRVIAFVVPSLAAAQTATSPAVDRAQLERRIEEQRQSLNRLEQQARISLREEVLLADTSRNPVVAQLIDQMLKAQNQKADLLATEQKELATFMTPMQRAKVFGIEDLIRRRVNDMLRQGATADSASRPIKPIRNQALRQRRSAAGSISSIPN
jgi:Spy/CpxP family protein refolding chaperone